MGYYAGHMARTTGDKWNQRLYEWTTYGNLRRRGRPKLRWRDEICGKMEVMGGKNDRK